MNAVEVSSVTVVMGQTFMSAPSAPPTARVAALEGVALTEGSAPLGANTGSS
jgi:hypothetical protein